ncbi:NUDIX hydrolase [Psychroserpens algicola]|uniref:NUDIX hydrolase n=1 Tax=Psychroserpens algicola TaxID=1719034 RepID=UPI0019530F43|nr:NUDIX hydrolase [Psychroserpens algicola]
MKTSKILFTCKNFDVVEDSFISNKQKKNYIYIKKSDAVGIIPVTKSGKVILIKHYRYPLNKYYWEIPAGRIELKEQIDDAAQRELNEELGLFANELNYFDTIYSLPSFCSEKIHVFIAKSMTPCQKSNSIDEADLHSEEFSFDDCEKMILNNEIESTASALVLLKYFSLLRQNKL